MGPHFEKPLPTSDYETSARETIRLGDIVSSPLIVSDGGNTVNFSFENVINTQAARLKSQQILDDIKGTVLGDAINKNFKETSTANLIGQTITSPADLAALAQIYRNPSFETFRYFFVKNGEVVWQTGVTARLPNYSPDTVPAIRSMEIIALT